MTYAIRRRSDNRVVGMSTYYTSLASQSGIEIGTSFLHPDARGGPINPEAKLLMLDHAFSSGAVRVQFRVDTRNLRSQAAVTKLGALREGILRKDRRTWTGYIRDTVHFSILDHEWPAVKQRLRERLSSERLTCGLRPGTAHLAARSHRARSSCPWVLVNLGEY